MAPLASFPFRRRLSPPSTAPIARCNNTFVSLSSPPQKRNSGNSWDPLSGWDEGVILANPSGGPAILSSTQKGEQDQYPAPLPKERPPDPTVADIPTGGQGTKENRGLLPSLGFLPDNDCNSTSTANPPSPAKKGHGLKLRPILHFLEPGKGKTSTPDSPPSPMTPVPPPPGPTNPPFGPPPAAPDQPSKLEGTPAPLPPALLAKPDGNTPPPAQTTSAQTTTTTSDGGAVIVSPTVTRSSVTDGEPGASFPTGEASSSVLPATSSSRTRNTNTIKSAFVYVTTIVDSTSRTECLWAH
ncbi:hypothetical protein K443DRAFT_539884 [Laccaria amethystina LaAM-08-1]|uniref:Unplaced genomic scaffold K443scaffold_62, whole genome shotgun sequence n=1 Tax=Laccaria amethystina LaAM-08-1 TaxID=1095629 RepID=A0A0C9XKQ7_9AGAR|nr:hypothetical protein K443DRAFT_539884 [Laccaria amethystina LaAM-08-1]